MKKILVIIFSFLVMSSAFANLEEIFGNAETGDTCSSDYQCQSLCCNSYGTCGASAESCRKPVGQRCISSAFCATDYIPVCKIVKTGTSADGTVLCAMRCPLVEVRGKCRNNICHGPEAPPVPPFNPSDCANAVDP